MDWLVRPSLSACLYSLASNPDHPDTVLHGCLVMRQLNIMYVNEKHICVAVGSKYNPKELFDITRRTSPSTSTSDGAGTSAQTDSCLQVQIPCDLIRRSTIAVSIEIGMIL